MGFSREMIEQAVQNNKHNHLSATYYLLLKKYTAQALNDPLTKSVEPRQAKVMQSIEVDRHSNAKKSSVAKDDAIRAPIHDALVQKNHRREQSANATAGGREKGCWGENNDDARKAGSCERAEKDQDYQMIGA